MSLKDRLHKITWLRILYHYPQTVLCNHKDKKLIEKCRKKVKNAPDKIKKFKDIHKGERCFIVCNGPSLTPEDLDKISGEYTFGSNRIYNMFPHTSWRPTYYCEADPYVAKVMEKKDIDAISDSGSICFLNLRLCDDYPDGTKEKDNVFFYYIKPIFGVDAIKNENKLPDFSDDLAIYAYSGLMITYEMIQIAAYMGFAEMYIIGCDNNYKHTIETGKLEENKNVETNYPKLMGEADKRLPTPTFNPKTTLAYEAAKKYAEAHGIKIYNATRGGRLEVYERVEFDSLFS